MGAHNDQIDLPRLGSLHNGVIRAPLDQDHRAGEPCRRDACEVGLQAAGELGSSSCMKASGAARALSQSWVSEVKSENRVSQNQELTRLNFPVFGRLRQSRNGGIVYNCEQLPPRP